MITRDFFGYDVITNVRLTKGATEILTRCSQRHYDLKCRQAGERGGLVYGMHVSATVLADDEGTGIHHLHLSDLDLLTKIMEMADTPEEAGLYITIKTLLVEANEECRKVNQHVLARKEGGA